MDQLIFSAQKGFRVNETGASENLSEVPGERILMKRPNSYNFGAKTWTSAAWPLFGWNEWGRVISRVQTKERIC